MKHRFFLKILGIIILLLIGFITLTQVNFLDYESPMGYDKIDQITFENFRGLEFFRKKLYGSSQFAYIKTTMNYEFESDSIKINSLFHPSSSYVFSKKAYSNELLTHEKYHFKITELYVRIAKKKISTLKKVSKEEAEQLLKETKYEERQYQYRYDDDTFHSYVLSQQKKYENEIDSLLNLHDTYKNPKLPLK